MGVEVLYVYKYSSLAESCIWQKRTTETKMIQVFVIFYEGENHSCQRETISNEMHIQRGNYICFGLDRSTANE